MVTRVMDGQPLKQPPTQALFSTLLAGGRGRWEC